MPKKNKNQDPQYEYEGESNSKDVKPRRGCLGCFLVSLLRLFIVVMVFNVLLCVGAYFVGDHFAKQYLDMSAKDILGVLGGIVTSDSDKLVKDSDKPTGADLNNFYGGIKNQLFLSDEFDLKGEIEYIAGEFLERNPDVLPAAETGEEQSFEELLLDRLLRPENFRLTRLASFDYDDPKAFTDYRLQDKQLAAFLDSILNTPLLTDLVDEQVYKMTKIPLKVRFSVKQVVFFTENCEYREWTEAAEGEQATYTLKTGQVGKAKFTVSFQLRNLIKSLLKNYNAEKYSFFFNFLPKEYLLTLEVPVDKDAQPKVYLNNMNSKTMDNAFKLVATITEKLGGADEKVDVNAILTDIGSDVIYPILKTANSIVPLNPMSGAITVSPIDLALSFLADGGEGRATGADVLLLLKNLVTVEGSEMESVITNPYNKAFYCDDGNGGREIRLLLTDEQIAQYQAAIILNDNNEPLSHIDVLFEELSNKYFITLEDFDDLMDIISGVMDNKGDTDAMMDAVADKFSPGNLKEAYTDPTLTQEELSLKITDYMLAEIIDKHLSEVVAKLVDAPAEGELDIGALAANAGVEQVIIDVAQADDGYEHTYMYLTVSVDLRGLITGLSSKLPAKIADFIVGLCDGGQIAETLYFSAIVDITSQPEGDTAFTRAETVLILNSIDTFDSYRTEGESHMKRYFELVKKFAGIDVPAMMTEMIGAQVVPVVDNMKSMLNVSFSKSSVKMPDIFTLIATLMGFEVQDGVDGEGNPVMRKLTGEEIRDALRALDYGDILADDTGAEGVLGNLPAGSELNALLAEIESKYYLKKGTLTFEDSLDEAISWKLNIVNGVYPDQTRIDEWKEGKTQAEKDDLRAEYRKAMEQEAVDFIMGGGMLDDLSSNIRYRQEEGMAGLLDDTRGMDNIHDLDITIADKAMVSLVSLFMTDSTDSLPADIVQISVKEEVQGEFVLEIVLMSGLTRIMQAQSGNLDMVNTIKKFLPEGAMEKIYIVASVYLGQVLIDNGVSYYRTEFDINALQRKGMTEENNALQLLIKSFAGDIFGNLQLTVGKAVYTALESFEESIDPEYIDGGIKLDNIYAQITSAAGLAAVTPEEVRDGLRALDYGTVISDISSAAHTAVYDNEAAGTDFDEFLADAEVKYYFNTGVLTGGDRTETVNKLTDGSMFESDALKDNLQYRRAGNKAGLLDDTTPIGELDLILNDKALVGFINVMLEGGTMSEISAEVVQATIRQDPVRGTVFELLLLTDMDGILDGMTGGMADMLPSGVFNNIYVVAVSYIDELTLSNDGYVTELDINALSKLNESGKKAALDKLIAEFALNALSDVEVQIGKALYSALSNFGDLSEGYVENGISLGNVYGHVVRQMGLNMSDGELCESLRALDYATAIDADAGLTASVHDHTADAGDFKTFLGDIESKYYFEYYTLNYAGEEPDKAKDKAAVDKLTSGTMFDQNELKNTIRFKGNNEGLLDDPRYLSDLNLVISDKALVRMIDIMSGEGGIDVPAQILQVNIKAVTGGYVMEVLLSADMDELMGSSTGGIADILPASVFDKIYIVAVVDLMTEYTDGAESYYDVEIDINALSKLNESGKKAALDKLIAEFAVNALSDVKVQLGKAVYSALSDIDDLSEGYVENGIDFGNIFDKIVRNSELYTYDQIAAANVKITDGEDLRQILKSADRGADITNGALRNTVLNNLPQGGELAGAFAEMEDKYYLARRTFTGSNEDEMVGILTDPDNNYFEGLNISTDMRAWETTEDGVVYKGLLDDVRTPEALKVLISSRAIAKIIADGISESSNTPVTVMQVNIYESAAHKYLEIVLLASRSDLVADGGDLSALLPDDVLSDFYITLTFDLDSVLTDTEDDADYYAAGLDINYLKGGGYAADYDELVNFLKAQVADHDMFDELCITAGKSLYETLNKIDETIGYEVDTSTGNGGIYLSSVYKVIADSLGITVDEYRVKMNDAAITEDEFYGVLQSTLQGMHLSGDDYIELTEGSIKNGAGVYTVQELKELNEQDIGTFGVIPNISAFASERIVAAYIAPELESDAFGDKYDAKVIKVTIIPEGADRDLEYLEFEFLPGEDYLLFTVEATVLTADNEWGNLMPQSVIFNMMIKKDGMENVGYFINKLGEKERVMAELIISAYNGGESSFDAAAMAELGENPIFTDSEAKMGGIITGADAARGYLTYSTVPAWILPLLQ